MTAPTTEAVDWSALTPDCEAPPHEGDAPVQWVLRNLPFRCYWLICSPCADAYRKASEDGGDRDGRWECARCGHESGGRGRDQFELEPLT